MHVSGGGDRRQIAGVEGESDIYGKKALYAKGDPCCWETGEKGTWQPAKGFSM